MLVKFFWAVVVAVELTSTISFLLHMLDLRLASTAAGEVKREGWTSEGGCESSRTRDLGLVGLDLEFSDSTDSSKSTGFSHCEISDTVLK